MIRLSHGACTHVGQVRRDNEDAFVALDGLYVVADGMGGHSAGEVASALTVTTIKDAYTATVPGRVGNGHGDPVKHGLTTPEQ
ncbi:MAG: PP2C family protein-serine/threonine phosphatase, partial [Actinomycetota bacterium]